MITLTEINAELQKRNIAPLVDPKSGERPQYGVSLLQRFLYPPKKYSSADQDFAALQAKIMLIGGEIVRGLIIPNYDEWVGVNVLERDDQLPRLKRS